MIICNKSQLIILHIIGEMEKQKNMLQPIFHRQVVDEHRKDSYWVQPVNGARKRPDLIGYGLGNTKVTLFDNPTWESFQIAKYEGGVAMEHADLTGNGLDDAVICYQYGATMYECDPDGGKIDWLENPGKFGKEWKKHYIGKSCGMHRLKLGYFTQTQKIELLGLPIVSKPHCTHSDLDILLYQQPEDLQTAECWKQSVAVKKYFHIIHDASVSKYNKHFGIKPESPLDSLIIASEEGLTWLYYDLDTKSWNIVPISSGQTTEVKDTGFKGSGNIIHGKVGDDPCAYIATVEPFHGNTICIYYKVKGQQNDPGWNWRWEREILDVYGDPDQRSGQGTGHHVVSADFDGDGDDQFIVALRGPHPWKGVFYYKAIDVSRGIFVKWKITEDSAARIALGDFNGDGRIDFATMGYYVPGYYEDENPCLIVYHNKFGPLKNPANNFSPPPGQIVSVSEKKNQIIPIKLSESIPAYWLKNFQTYRAEERAIFVNLGSTNTVINAPPKKYLLPRQSTILKGVELHNVHQVLMIPLVQNLDFGKVILESGWNQLGEIADFPKTCALYKGRQFDLGIVSLDPQFATKMSPVEDPKRRKNHRLKVNIWYCPSRTDCAIHCVHQKPLDFLEVHTQIYGVGRMQKFHTDQFETRYEDTVMGPGMTHQPYASLNEKGEYIYPWHQYYGDSECIWMANEFHVI